MYERADVRAAFEEQRDTVREQRDTVREQRDTVREQREPGAILLAIAGKQGWSQKAVNSGSRIIANALLTLTQESLVGWVPPTIWTIPAKWWAVPTLQSDNLGLYPT